MPDVSITNKEYKEWPEKDYTRSRQYMRNINMFERVERKNPGNGDVLYPVQRDMYEFIRDSCIDIVKNHPQYPKFVWKPKICDVGCGGGWGSNILSQEADWVWGIDKCEESIQWCKRVFTRHKNNIYYTPQVSFNVVDIKNEPRTIQPFDIVVCIEVIEHIDDYISVLNFIKRLCKKHKKTGEYLEPPNATICYISSPNRNYQTMGKEYPRNKRHVREWTPDELYAVLTKHFKYVVLRNPKGEPQELSMTEPHMLFECQTPITNQ